MSTWMNDDSSANLCVRSHDKHHCAHMREDTDCNPPATFPFMPLTTIDLLPRGTYFKALVAQADMIPIPNVRIDGFLLFLLFAHLDLAKTLNGAATADTIRASANTFKADLQEGKVLVRFTPQRFSSTRASTRPE